MSSSDTTGFNTLQAISKADRFNYWMYRVICPYISGNILELGSGIGNLSRYFVINGSTITLSDVTPEYHGILKRAYGNQPNVKGILLIDLQDPEFEQKHGNLKEAFDSVFLLNVVEHVKNDSHALRICNFLLKPGGVILVLVPAYSWLYSKMDKALGHYRRYTIRSLATLVNENGFGVSKIFYFNFLGIFAWLFGKIAGFQNLSENNMGLYNKMVPLARVLDKIVFNKAGLSTIVVAKKKH